MSFNDKYLKIKSLAIKELSIIENKMLNSIDVCEPLQSHIIKFLSAPSKRIRPLLAILYQKADNLELTKQQLEYLSVVELVHNASLIHDDIIDESEFRRGNKTVCAEFDNKLGVISGDYILSVAMEKASELGAINLLKNLSITLKQMCVGEINQNFSRFKIGTIEDYIEKSKNKTAYLFASAIKGCLELSEKKYDLQAAEEFGINTGIAFQIRDDLRNLINSDTSKPVNNDIKEGIYNAPVIYAGDVENYSAGIEKTRILLNNYIKKAIQQIEYLPNNRYKSALREFLELLNNE